MIFSDLQQNPVGLSRMTYTYCLATRHLFLLGLFASLLLGNHLAAQQPSLDREIANQIERLADPRYSQRVAAKKQLLEYGLKAYDALYASTDHPDPEVAASASQLLRELTSDWALREYSTAIRQRLNNFADKPIAGRVATVRGIAVLPDSGVMSVLCRISRFDPSPRVSREAAAAILGQANLELEQDDIEQARLADNQLTKEFGPSSRTAAQWIKIAVDEGLTATERYQAWQRAVALESKEFNNSSTKTTENVVATLLAQQLLSSIASEDPQEILRSAEAFISIDENQSSIRLADTLEHLSDLKQWEVVEQLLQAERSKITKKRALYIQAMVAADRGYIEESEKLAEEAFAAESDELPTANSTVRFSPRLRIAEELLGRGYINWARRELRAIVEGGLRPLAFENAFACWRLADSLQDAQEYQEATELLSNLSKAINSGQHTRRLFKSISNRSGFLIPAEPSITSRAWLYEAMSHNQSGDTKGEIDALRKAIAHDPQDADVLIAMYRVDSSDQAFKLDTKRRIIELSESFDEAIAENPTEATPLNQWAWLVSNTEGDYKKAVRYSRRSLELSPGEAGYLDTLGRCLYAIGDLKGAREVQQQAVDLMPNMQVMRRQLELIERTIAEQESTESP